MRITVNNREAILKAGTSIEYVSENRLFSGSDAFTLTITFPLNGCAENLAIFGNINRADVSAGTVVFECELRDRGFYKYGSLVINEINESEVKAQFLEGRSAQNFDTTFDDIYINSLTLGTAPTTAASQITPANAWNPATYSNKYVALPWVNDASANIQNCAVKKEGNYVWHEDTKGLSWQPYLLWLTEAIFNAAGYTADLSVWENDASLRQLISCNTLPYAWGTSDFAKALPEWSLTDYLEKLELFIGCEFDIDHKRKHISMRFSEDILRSMPIATIENVVDEFTTEVKVEDNDCEYLGAQNIVYKECSYSQWKFLSCDWFMRTLKETDIIRYPSLFSLININRSLSTWNGSSSRGSNRDKVLYAADCDMYFVVNSVSKDLVKEYEDRPNIYKYTCMLQPVNVFGGRIVDASEDARQTEIEFVPANIDYTDEEFGNLLILNFSDYNEQDSEDGVSIFGESIEDRINTVNATLYNSRMVNLISAGEKEKSTEYYDRIYVAFYDGHTDMDALPRPSVCQAEISEDWKKYKVRTDGLRSLCLTGASRLAKDKLTHIEPNRKTTFKFLADAIPDVRATFIIKGKKYLCEKITATFSENGMSQMMKGMFYPVADN